jgi:pullulanase/glycogen debranching enzyme
MSSSVPALAMPAPNSSQPRGVHWDLDEDQQALVRFFRRPTALFHLYPVLRRSHFFTGEINPATGVKDVTWIDANGSEMKAEAGKTNGRALSACCWTGARRSVGSSGKRAT